MGLNLTVLLFLFVVPIFILAESCNAFVNCVHLLETKRRKTKKRNVPKHHQKAIAQPDVPEVQAGKSRCELLAPFTTL